MAVLGNLPAGGIIGVISGSVLEARIGPFCGSIAGMKKKTVPQLIWEVFSVGIGAAILQAIARWMLHRSNATWFAFGLGLAT